MQKQQPESKLEAFLADVIPAFGCAGIIIAVLIAGMTGFESAKKKLEAQAAAEAKIVRPVIKGKIIAQATIPDNLSERAKQEYPYWVQIELPDKQVITLTFDTDDPFWDPKRGKTGGIYIKGNNSEDFQNKTLFLNDLLKVGYNIKAKTFTDEGVSRQVYTIIKVTKP